MPRMIAIISELAIWACALWILFLLSTVLHEVGHALGYMVATGDGHWHIRVGSGKRLLDTKRLTVKLLPSDGNFTPLNTDKIDTATKLIMILSGGPIASLIVVVGLLLLKHGDISSLAGIIAPTAVESFIDSGLSINLFMLVLSLIPTHYFYGEIKGMETDGLQILNTIKSHRSKR